MNELTPQTVEYTHVYTFTLERALDICDGAIKCYDPYEKRAAQEWLVIAREEYDRAESLAEAAYERDCAVKGAMVSGPLLLPPAYSYGQGGRWFLYLIALLIMVINVDTVGSLAFRHPLITLLIVFLIGAGVTSAARCQF